jgi:hypothetical protein
MFYFQHGLNIVYMLYLYSMLFATCLKCPLFEK